MKLYLKKSDYTTILEHCTAGLPNESCGLLAGTREDEEITVTKVYLLTNVDASREHFSMDPKEQLKAHQRCQSKWIQNHRELSFPSGIPFPSIRRRQTTGI